VLFVDVDGVISLFGFAPDGDFPGAAHSVDGILHCIATDCGERLRRLDEHFELVWATGWEEKANEYLPLILELPFKELPSLTFDGRAVFGSAHWKLGAIDDYAGDRPAAWIDDNLDELAGPGRRTGTPPRCSSRPSRPRACPTSTSSNCCDGRSSTAEPPPGHGEGGHTGPPSVVLCLPAFTTD